MNAPLHFAGSPNQVVRFQLGADYAGSPFGNPNDIVELDHRTRILTNHTQSLRIQLAVAPGDVMDAEANRSYLSGYRLPGMWADKICPVVSTSVHKDKYTTTSSASAFQIPNVETTYDGPVNTIEPSWSQEEYETRWYGLGTYVANMTQDAVRDVRNPTTLGMRRIAEKLTMARELRVLTMLTTIANWAPANVVTLGAGLQWNGGANSAPIVDLQNRILASRQQVTKIYMGQEAGFAFVMHESVKTFVNTLRGNDAGIQVSGSMSNAMTEDVMISVPMLPPICIVASEYETADGTRTRMLPNQVVLTSSQPGVPTDAQSLDTCKTFRYKGQGLGYITRAYVVHDRGVGGGMMHLVYCAETHVMTGPNVGGLIEGVIQ